MWAKIGRALPYLLLYIAAFAIVGLFNILTVRENPDIWTDAEFWNRTISQNLANLLVLIATISLFITKRMTDSDYILLSDRVSKAVYSDLDAGFGVWVFDTNKKLKVDAYRAKVQAKINRGELRARPHDLQLWYYGTDEEKKRSWYCRKRKRLEESMSPDRLDKLILALKVDYDELDRAFIETGETRKISKKNQKQASTTLIVKENWSRFAFSLAGAAFFNAFLYDADIMDATFWFQIATSVFLMASMFISGMEYAKSYKQQVLMGDLNTRYNIIKDYLTHKVGKFKEAK